MDWVSLKNPILVITLLCIEISTKSTAS